MTDRSRFLKRKPLGAFFALFLLMPVACSPGEDTPREESAAREEGDEEEFENPCARDAPPEASALEGERPKEGATIVAVTGVEYAFQGIQDQYPAGNYGFELTNSGQQVHEIALVKVKAGETRSIAELMQLPEEEQEQAAEYVGGTVACPGDKAEALGVELQSGRYSMVCFIPVGFTPETTEQQAEDLGPPHFTQGMVKDFTVS